MFPHKIPATGALIALHGTKIDAIKAVTDALTVDINSNPTVDLWRSHKKHKLMQVNIGVEDYRNSMTVGVKGEISGMKNYFSSREGQEKRRDF